MFLYATLSSSTQSEEVKRRYVLTYHGINLVLSHLLDVLVHDFRPSFHHSDTGQQFLDSCRGSCVADQVTVYVYVNERLGLVVELSRFRSRDRHWMSSNSLYVRIHPQIPPHICVRSSTRISWDICPTNAVPGASAENAISNVRNGENANGRRKIRDVHPRR